MLDRRPGPAAIMARPAGGGPFGRTGAELVVEPENPVARVEEHRVVAGHAGLAGQFDRRRPGAGETAGTPDGDIAFAFAAAAEPGGQELAGRCFDDGGGVAGRERRALEEKLGAWRRG